MGNYILRNVNFSIDKKLAENPSRDFDIEADSFLGLKESVDKFAQEIAAEFGVNIRDIKVKGATLDTASNKVKIF